MSFHELLYEVGPVRFGAVDEDGRRFPCECHREPHHWMMMAMRPCGDGGFPCVSIPFPENALQPAPAWVIFENALLTLWDIPQHPELYS